MTCQDCGNHNHIQETMFGQLCFACHTKALIEYFNGCRTIRKEENELEEWFPSHDLICFIVTRLTHQVNPFFNNSPDTAARYTLCTIVTGHGVQGDVSLHTSHP